MLRFRVLNLAGAAPRGRLQRGARDLAVRRHERDHRRDRRLLAAPAAHRAARPGRRTPSSRSGRTTATSSHVIDVHLDDIHTFQPTYAAPSGRRCRPALGLPRAARRRDRRRRRRARRGRRQRRGRARLRDAAVPRLHAGRVRLRAHRSVRGARRTAPAWPTPSWRRRRTTCSASASATTAAAWCARCRRRPRRRRPSRPGRQPPHAVHVVRRDPGGRRVRDHAAAAARRAVARDDLVRRRVDLRDQAALTRAQANPPPAAMSPPST